MCSDCAQMIRYVLFAGVVSAAAFTFIWLLFTVALALGNDPTPFTRTGPAFKLWLVCLLVAIVVDSVMRPAARTVVSAFATSLTAVAGKGTCEVRQSSRWDAGIRTTTSGYFQGRRTTVVVDQTGKFSFLNLEMDFRAPCSKSESEGLLPGRLALSACQSELETRFLTQWFLFKAITRPRFASGHVRARSSRGFFRYFRCVESPLSPQTQY
jgi:hypothetical protein